MAFLDDTCRFCLVNANKDNFKILLDLTESHCSQFLEVTQKYVKLNLKRADFDFHSFSFF
jgi:hypothetical protein